MCLCALSDNFSHEVEEVAYKTAVIVGNPGYFLGSVLFDGQLGELSVAKGFSRFLFWQLYLLNVLFWSLLAFTIQSAYSIVAKLKTHRC